MPLQQELSPEDFKKLAFGSPDEELSPEAFKAAAFGGQPTEEPEAPGFFSSLAGSALEGLSAIPAEARLAADKLGLTEMARRLPPATSMALGPLSAPLHLAQNPILLQKAEEGLKGAAQAVYPEEQRGQGGFWSESVPSAVGGTLAALPGIAIGGPAAALTFGAQNGVPLYYEIKGNGGSEEDAIKGLLFGNAVGQLEKFGAEKYMGSVISKLSKGKFGQALKRAALGWAVGAPSEAATEGLQQGLSDVALEELSYADVDNWGRLMDAMKAAGVVGGFASGLDAAISARGAERGSSTRPGQTALPQTEGIAAPTTGAAPASTEAAEPQSQPAQGTGLTVGAPTVELAPSQPQPTVEVRPEPAQKPRTVADISEATAPGGDVEQAQEGKTVPPAPGGEQTAAVGETPETVATTPEAPQAAAAEETVPEPEATGVKNRTVERELEKMGLEMPEKGKRKGFVELHAKAKETFDASEGKAGQELLDDLEASPRPPSDEESALLTFEANRLIQERNKAETAYTEKPTAQNKVLVERAREDYYRAAGVFDMAGTQSGRALNARKMMLANDYSLAAMERAVQVSQGGEELTAEQSKKIKELSEQLAANEKAIQEAKTQAELKDAEHAAEVAMLKLQKEAKGLSRRSKRKAEIEQTKKELGEILEELGRHTRSKAAAGLGGLDAKVLALTAKAAAKTIKLGGQTFVQWADSMVARFGEGIRPYLKPAWEAGGEENRLSVGEALKSQQTKEQTQRTVEKIALSFVEGGVTDSKTLTQKVHSVVSHFRPDMTLEQTRDAISGYGIFKKLSRNQARQKLNTLKGEMRELAKIEDLLAGQVPKKTGFERRQKTQKELRLSDKASTLAKKLGLQPTRKKTLRLKVGTATEEQVALKQTEAKLKAYKTKLQNQIADLQERIRAKDFSVKEKKPVQLDEAAIKQVAEREKLKGEFEKVKREAEMSQWGPGRKTLHGLAEMSKASRALRFGFDLPPIFRQASKIAVPDIFLNPKRLATFTARGIGAMSEKRAAEMDAKMRQGDKYELAQAAKLSLPPVEEEMQSWVASKLAPVRASGRVYNTFMNQYRMSLFSAMLEGLPTTPTLDDAKLIASGVNILTGRGNVAGKAAAFMEGAGTILTAPRLYLSQFQSMLAVPALKAQVAGNKAVRNQFVKQYAKTIAGYAALYALMQAYDELDGEDDIKIGTSGSDWGKIIVGNKRYDPLGGFSQALVLVARGINEGRKTVMGERKEPKYGEETYWDTVGNFIRMRLAPFPSVIADTLIGTQVDKDASGKPLPTTIGSSLKKTFVPLSVEEIIEETQKLGVKKADAEDILTAIMDRTLGLFGMSVKDYGPKKRKSLLKGRRGA